MWSRKASGRQIGHNVKRTPSIALSAAAAATAAVLVFAAPASANPNEVNPIPVLNGAMGLPQLHGRTQAVFQATGMASPNNTQNYNVLDYLVLRNSVC